MMTILSEAHSPSSSEWCLDDWMHLDRRAVSVPFAALVLTP